MATPSDSARDNGLAAIVAGLDTRYRTLGEMVYEVIKEAILTGALRPGQRLRQEALAETLDVSRIPVRSALMQLEREGLVSFRAGRGAVVRTLSAGQVREIYELRELLEAHAVRKVMASMTPERLARLGDLAAQAAGRRRAPSSSTSARRSTASSTTPSTTRAWSRSSRSSGVPSGATCSGAESPRRPVSSTDTWSA
jgi:DNA-binding transcriptional regulator YhcF (GntR family)